MSSILVAGLCLGIGFAAGTWYGTHGAGTGSDVPDSGERIPVQPQPDGDPFAALAEAGAWRALVDRLEGLRYSDPQRVPGERRRLLDLAADLARQGRSDDALQLVAGYVSGNPRDAEAQFLAADLYVSNGRQREALEPMFAILDFPPDARIAGKARAQLDSRIGAMVAQLADAGDVTGLVGLYQELVLREPGYDKHRLGLIRWLVRGARYAEAAAELKELGSVGVSHNEVEAVRSELALARSELPMTRVGSMLFADLRVAGVPVRVLVDTGATQTGMRPKVLKRVGGTDMGRAVRVRTAAGTVSARLHRVRNVELGELRVAALEVLALDALPGGVDGLLGMDVISRYPRLELD